MNPGSEEAIKAGCKCPTIDNNNGDGYMGQDGVFVQNEYCPLHGRKTIRICPKCGNNGEMFTADLDWCSSCHHQWSP